jgi:hypothetical protein
MYFRIFCKIFQIFPNFSEISETGNQFSKFFRFSRSDIANSLVSTSYFRKVGSKIAKIATKMTHIRPPEVTETDKEVAEATIAARICPVNGPIE